MADSSPAPTHRRFGLSHAEHGSADAADALDHDEEAADEASEDESSSEVGEAPVPKGKSNGRTWQNGQFRDQAAAAVHAARLPTAERKAFWEQQLQKDSSGISR